MKHLSSFVFTVSSLALLCCLKSVATLAAPEPLALPIPITTAYVPVGFDDNDRVQVTVEIKFQDSCYKLENHSFQIKGHQIELLALGSHLGDEQKGRCTKAEFLVPQIFELGKLAQGLYQLIDSASKKPLGELNVDKSNKGSDKDPDEATYAPVRDATQKDMGQGNHELSLMGIMPLLCLQIKSIDIKVFKNVVIVRPTMQSLSETPDCLDGVFPFEELSRFQAPKGRYLLHVRSLNGMAINKIVDLK